MKASYSSLKCHLCSVALECMTNPSSFTERKRDIKCKLQCVLSSLGRSQHHFTIHPAFTEADISIFFNPIILVIILSLVESEEISHYFSFSISDTSFCFLFRPVCDAAICMCRRKDFS